MKYRLIKEYPDSPELGTIIESPYYVIPKSNGVMISGAPLQGGKYKEFWEKVVERDFEVLEITFNDGSRLRVGEGRPYSWEDDVVKELAKITKVKRLSDGEVFSVGDKVSHKGVVDTIKELKIRYDGAIYVSTVGGMWGQCLASVDKYVPKIPVFVSDDGVDVFEGDTYFLVGEHDERISQMECRSSHVRVEGNKRFVGYHKAQEYIDSKLVDVKLTRGEFNKLKKLLK